jgi:16S rRNA (uracil1498-N3)-methyltransferase
MQRYFIPSEQMTENSCVITGQDAHHINKVIRLQLNDEIVCCNGDGRTVLAKISEMSKDTIQCVIIKEMKEHRELPVDVIVVQGLPKGDKLEWIIQKGTEMGAHGFIPFSSSRTIVKYDPKKEQKKIDRWEKIAKEAAEQSHRSKLPYIGEVSSFKKILELEAECKLVAYERASLDGLKDLNASFTASSFFEALKKVKQGDRIIIVIGPEGGLEEEEIIQLEKRGFTTISLGKRILRTETASQYALAVISFYFEQMGG